MKQSVHTIVMAPLGEMGMRERIVLETATALLWPLEIDDRITVLINLMAAQLGKLDAGEDGIDAVLDTLRLRLKLELKP